LTTFTRWILRHQRYVAAFWIAVTLLGIVFVSRITGALSKDFRQPGQEGFETNQAILRTYGAAGNRLPVVPVITLPPGTTVDSPGVKQQIDAALAPIAQYYSHPLIASYASTGDRAFVSKDGRTTFALIIQPGAQSGFGSGDAASVVQRAVEAHPIDGASWKVTGLDVLEGHTGGGGGPGVLSEAMLGGVGALIVLAFVFGSLLAFIPLLMALPAIMGTFLLIGLLNEFTSITFIVEFLVALIGLGVAIDYSLLVVMRWREECARGLENTAAVQRAMETAGEAVIHSGTTVAIGLVALAVLPVPFMRGLGFGGMLIPLVSVLVAITLLPVILNTIGPRIDWPHRAPSAALGRWADWARLVVRRRWIAAAAGFIVMGALLAAAFTINVHNPEAKNFGSAGEANAGLAALNQSGIGPGPLSPIMLLAPQQAANSLAASVAAVQGVHGAVAPAEWQRNGQAIVAVFPNTDANSSSGRATLSRVEPIAHNVHARVGGAVASSEDFISSVYGTFPLMIALIAIATFLLLARAFRSLLLPLKAVLLNVVSVGGAWGIMVLVWQHGWGSDLIWGIPATGSITLWVPIMVFAFLYGISMDYEVFILARMREQYDATGSTERAVIEGIGHTGRLVTFAALILFLAFASLASGPEAVVKTFATGLAAGIILDATIVRSMLVPALVSLFGDWNWWLPAWPAKLLRVEPSSARRPTAEAEGAGAE
jgi:RND superfamily putative drug exporter